MSNETLMLSYGAIPELYIEYVKRSEPFTMAEDQYHAYYEVYYLLSGTREYFIRDRTYTVEQGDLVFIAKHMLHKTMLAGEPAHERVILHFDDSALQRLAGKHTSLLLSAFEQDSPLIRLTRHEQFQLHELMKRMLLELQLQPSGYDLMLEHAAVQLLLMAARCAEQQQPAPQQHPSPIHAKVSEVAQYINVHYAEPIQLSMLSDLFFISPYYLSRMFKEVTGFTFSDYLILTRVKEAEARLRESSSSITEIAASVGFDNFSHFGKTFKKITRLSPREYRNQHR